MFIIDVIPSVKYSLSSPQILTYFCSQKVDIGGLVSILLNRRKVVAIVVDCADAKEKKAEIKKIDFELKGILKVISNEPVVSSYQIELMHILHQYYLFSLGGISKLFLPKSLVRRKTFVKNLPAFPAYNVSKPDNKNIPLLYWSENRLILYLEEIKNTLKQNKQIIFLSPEIQNIKKAADFLSKECQAKISVIHSELSVSREFAEWRKIKSGNIDIICGTRSAIFFPITNPGLIIIDDEENHNYKSWDMHPRYDAKVAALKFAEITGSKIILGSDFPSIDSYHKARQGQYRLIKSQESVLKPKVILADMKEEMRRHNFSIFSESLQKALKEVLSKNEQAYLFVGRRGIATSVFCRDCGYVVKCKDCDVSMVYHSQTQGNNEVLLCHHCGNKMSPPSRCPKCRGDRIKYFGSGTQKVIQELKRLVAGPWGFGDLANSIARIDSDIAPDARQQEKIFEDFKKGKYKILIGTQLLLKNSRKVSLVGIILIDPILSLPEFRSSERGFRLLSRFKFLGEKMIIQAYNETPSLLQFFQNGETELFLQQEIKSRQELFYPPFSQIAKLSYPHKDFNKAINEADKLAETIDGLMEANGLQSFVEILGPAPAFPSCVRGKYVWHIILKITGRTEEVKKILINTISRGWTVDIDPQSLL